VAEVEQVALSYWLRWIVSLETLVYEPRQPVAKLDSLEQAQVFYPMDWLGLMISWVLAALGSQEEQELAQWAFVPLVFLRGQTNNPCQNCSAR